MSTNIYHLNYYNLIKATMFFLLVGNLARSLTKTPSAIIELILLGTLLFFAIIYAVQNYKIRKGSTMIFLLFLIYLLLHTISASIMRPYILGTTFFETLKFNLLEFRISTLSYFLPLIFIPLSKENIRKLESFFYLLFKISIAYTIFEQFISLIGFRTFFESLYMNSGVVTGNQIGAKSLGMYRVWGLIGSPQLLGVFHIMTLFFMLYKKDNFWVILSFFAVIFSTSKTAYLILIAIGLLYLLYEKKYISLVLLSFSMIVIFILGFEYYYYLEEQNISGYRSFRKFMGSIIGYIILMYNVHEAGQAAGGFIPGGPLVIISTYFSYNPLELFVGKGITYAFQDTLIMNSPFAEYLYLTSDFYILSFFEQYGILGILLLLYVFLVYPLKSLFIDRNILYFIPIIFFISMLHYPPQISKLMMIIVAYPLCLIFFNNEAQDK